MNSRRIGIRVSPGFVFFVLKSGYVVQVERQMPQREGRMGCADSQSIWLVR
jgi:hypothetical protein